MNAVKTGTVTRMPDQSPEPPLLPQHASGSRPPAPPETDSLSLDDAVRIYGVSMSTLRRRLRTDAIPGAYKVPGPKGDEWRIPKGALEQVGFQPIPEPVDNRAPRPVDAPARSAAGDELARTLDALQGVLQRFDTTQRQLTAAEEDRGRAEREREEARVEAAELRGRLEAAEAELERRRRRWWQRG